MQINNCKALVLHRINYGEADRIVTSITSDGKKISIFAKGVRKPKSKLIAGTELFCLSDIGYIQKKASSMATLVSAKIIKQHTNFLNDLDRVQLAYDLIKIINKHTEENVSDDYFSILSDAFAALDTASYDVDVVRVWIWLKLLNISGHRIQLHNQINGDNFIENVNYFFDIQSGGFSQSDSGNLSSDHIKYLRVALTNDIAIVQRVKNANQLSLELKTILNQFVETTY